MREEQEEEEEQEEGEYKEYAFDGARSFALVLALL